MKNLQQFDASRFLASQVEKTLKIGYNVINLRSNGPITVKHFEQAAKANKLAIKVDGLKITLARNNG
jgi:hypothetical protein